MIRCTCGGRFKAVETGVGVVVNNIIGPGIYAADVLECDGCSKQILELAGTPLAIGKGDVDAEIKRLEAKGKAIYGRES